MIYRITIIFLLFLLQVSLFGWGDEGHALIAKKAVTLLPDSMTDFKQWAEYIEKHSSDPDNRKRDDKSEGPKHYIDIDYYPEFLSGDMIPDKGYFVEKYGDSIVTEMGLLPWATFDTYKSLIRAFKEKNRDRILIFTTDLAHYVADGHQPMHTIMNYDGQLTGQKGLHARYEIHMINKYLQELENSFYRQQSYYINDPLNFIFFYITNANLVSELLAKADIEAFNYAGNRESDEYFRILWFRTKYITVLQMNNAASALASLIYSAWTDAGKPGLTDFD